jgi:hypothetical protein
MCLLLDEYSRMELLSSKIGLQHPHYNTLTGGRIGSLNTEENIER